jgi:hypothetical protein
MKRRFRLTLAFLLVAAMATSCEEAEKGACVPKASPMNCGDDMSYHECRVVNGTFYAKLTCRGLGY